MYIHFSVSGFFPHTYVFFLTWRENWNLKKFFKLVNFSLCECEYKYECGYECKLQWKRDILV